MPNITVFISESNRLKPDIASELSSSFKDLCVEVLRAKESNVHVCYVYSEIGFGTPIYIEVKLRKEVFRTAPVLNDFVSEIDLLIRERVGVVARIRCFSYENDSIHAKN
ncbi:hypothetical protein BZL54_00880 [Burkholderia ubonensis subsp. mesacidophila]|uniref:Uncharacterized protein n=1 Tax=Burkholderia ubonensis subsp. mesacidophila TaxID=265293 RepID=A0A2A4FNB8_9BURK|nr:hypothetical protein BZL54_00880 [Burkholderia ubonensis subsp. mesacidophila]